MSTLIDDLEEKNGLKSLRGHDICRSKKKGDPLKTLGSPFSVLPQHDHAATAHIAASG
jgi:hypothetical protein